MTSNDPIGGCSPDFPRLQTKATLVVSRIVVHLRGRLVLQTVSATFKPGRITAVIGPNGAGKSTLLKTMAGLLMPNQGDVALDGRSLRSFDRRHLAQCIAYLPQERILNWPLSVSSIVALGRLPHGGTSRHLSPIDESAIERAMSATDVIALSDRSVEALSGGEQARVLFARALAQETPIILADEPTAGLDPAHALELVIVLERLAAAGRTVVVALHDLTLAARFCHDVVLLAHGEVLASGGAPDILAAEQLGRAFGVHMAVGRIDNVPVVVPISHRSGPRW